METETQPTWRKEFKKVCSDYIKQCSESSELKKILKRWRDLSDKENDPTKLLTELKKDGHNNIDFCEAYHKERHTALDVQIVLSEFFYPIELAITAIAKLSIPEKPDVITTDMQPTSILPEQKKGTIEKYIESLNKNIERLSRKRRTEIRQWKIYVLSKIKTYLHSYNIGRITIIAAYYKIDLLLKNTPKDSQLSYMSILRKHTNFPMIKFGIFGQPRKNPDSYTVVDEIYKEMNLLYCAVIMSKKFKTPPNPAFSP